MSDKYSLLSEETEERIRACEDKWDELLARPEAKRPLRQMAREALEDYHAGRTTGIIITEDGQLAPDNPLSLEPCELSLQP